MSICGYHTSNFQSKGHEHKNHNLELIIANIYVHFCMLGNKWFIGFNWCHSPTIYKADTIIMFILEKETKAWKSINMPKVTLCFLTICVKWFIFSYDSLMGHCCVHIIKDVKKEKTWGRSSSRIMKWIILLREFRPRWRCRYKHFTSSHNQKKDNNQFKNKQPEVPENQTAWSSDNQGIKETFTQTRRRGGDGSRAAQRRGHMARRWTMWVRRGWLNRKLKTQS